jgi:hypothetical protein
MYKLSTVDSSWLSTCAILDDALTGVEPGEPTASVLSQIVSLQIRHSNSAFERLMLADVDVKAIAQYLIDKDND